jgi:hypothetical protein
LGKLGVYGQSPSSEQRAAEQRAAGFALLIALAHKIGRLPIKDGPANREAAKNEDLRNPYPLLPYQEMTT